MQQRGAGRKYQLLPGSELLREGHWKRVDKNVLKNLIKRFATHENLCREICKPTYRWRNRRLKAVAVYEERFERPPEIFCHHKLPPMKSYYVHDRKYVWPEHGEPGRPIDWCKPGPETSTLEY